METWSEGSHLWHNQTECPSQWQTWSPHKLTCILKKKKKSKQGFRHFPFLWANGAKPTAPKTASTRHEYFSPSEQWASGPGPGLQLVLLLRQIVLQTVPNQSETRAPAQALLQGSVPGRACATWEAAAPESSTRSGHPEKPPGRPSRDSGCTAWGGGHSSRAGKAEESVWALHSN